MGGTRSRRSGKKSTSRRIPYSFPNIHDIELEVVDKKDGEIFLKASILPNAVFKCVQPEIVKEFLVGDLIRALGRSRMSGFGYSVENITFSEYEIFLRRYEKTLPSTDKRRQIEEE